MAATWVSLVVSGDVGNVCLFVYPPPSAKQSWGTQTARKFTKRKAGGASGPDGDLQRERSTSSSTVKLTPNNMSGPSGPSGPQGPTSSIAAPGVSGPDGEMMSGSSGLHILDDEADVFGMGGEELARLMCPKSSLCGRALTVAVDRFRFFSFPIRLPPGPNHQFGSFNVVFAIDQSQPITLPSLATTSPVPACNLSFPSAATPSSFNSPAEFTRIARLYTQVCIHI
jgi:hypothetical protein